MIDRRTREHSSLTAAQRSQRARIAVNARWAKADREAGTRPAREGFRQRFAQQVDPNGELPENERARRVDAAIRSHMQQLAYRRSRKRST
jgi:hypothetical protein